MIMELQSQYKHSLYKKDLLWPIHFQLSSLSFYCSDMEMVHKMWWQIISVYWSKILVRWQNPIFLVNLAMFGNNDFNAFSQRYHPKDQIPGGWPSTTRLAFSESKMAAAYIRNIKKWQYFPHIWCRVMIFSSNIMFLNTLKLIMWLICHFKGSFR